MSSGIVGWVVQRLRLLDGGADHLREGANLDWGGYGAAHFYNQGEICGIGVRECVK